ncbi:MAG: cytochrome P450 [Bacteroidota bacterium]
MIPTYKSKSFKPAVLEAAKDPLKFVVEQSQQLSDFFKLSFFGIRTVFVSSNVEVLRHVLQTNQKNYKKSAAYKQLKLALGNGLVTSEGEFWRRQRRMAQPAFYKTQLEELYKKMVEVTEQHCVALQQKTNGEIVNISHEMMDLTAKIVVKTLFSTERAHDKVNMSNNMKFGQTYIMNRARRPYMIPLSYLNGQKREFEKRMAEFDQGIFDIIDERRQATEKPIDLLSMLLQATDDESGDAMTNRQLRDELVTIHAAGHETSSNALSWTLYLLAKHPKILDKLRTEIKTVLGDYAPPTFADLRNLPYTKQVIEEGMRLYPPAYAVGRQNLAKDEILGQTIPANSIFLLSIYALHRAPNYYPEPEKFDPDRFAPEQVKARPKLAYMPFSAGPRMCIGNHFAMMEMQLVLAMFVQRFDFELIDNKPVVPQPLVTLSPKGGIKMQLKLI